jgi:hypothetical protein
MHEDRTIPARRLKVEKRRGIYYRDTPTGRRYEITFLDSTGRRRWQTIEGGLRQAEAVLDEIKTRLRRGERIAPTNARLAEYAGTWLEGQSGRLRPKTITTYETALDRHVLPRLGRLKLTEITEDNVALLIAEMREGIYYEERDGRLAKLQREGGFAEWTIRGTLSPLSALLTQAARRGLVPVNVVSRLERGERPTPTEKEKRILTADEIRALLDACAPKYRSRLASALAYGSASFSVLSGRTSTSRRGSFASASSST